MWRTLIAIGIAPPGTAGPQADDAMPAAVGVGFTDVGSGQPGTDRSAGVSVSTLAFKYVGSPGINRSAGFRASTLRVAYVGSGRSGTDRSAGVVGLCGEGTAGSNDSIMIHGFGPVLQGVSEQTW